MWITEKSEVEIRCQADLKGFPFLITVLLEIDHCLFLFWSSLTVVQSYEGLRVLRELLKNRYYIEAFFFVVCYVGSTDHSYVV